MPVLSAHSPPFPGGGPALGVLGAGTQGLPRSSVCPSCLLGALVAWRETLACPPLPTFHLELDAAANPTAAPRKLV